MQNGLIGAMKGAQLPSATKFILFMVLAAGVTLVAKKAGIPMNGGDAVVVALLLGLSALIAEYVLSKEMTRLYMERLPGPLLLCFAVWAGAFTYGLNQWLGAASENQVEKGTIQKTAHTEYEDARGELNSAGAKVLSSRKEVDTLAERIAFASNIEIGGVKVTTPDAAQAIVDKTKAHRWWERTEQCTKTLGPDTRKFCDEYRQAEAAKATSSNRVTLEAELKAAKQALAKAEADHATAKKKASETKTVTSDERPDLRIAKAYFGVSEQAAADIQAIWTIIIISLFLTGIGVLEEAKKYRGQPRKPWPWTVWFRGLMYGQKPAATVEEPPTETPVSASGNRTPENRAYPQPQAWKAEIRTVADIAADMRRLAAA